MKMKKERLFVSIAQVTNYVTKFQIKHVAKDNEIENFFAAKTQLNATIIETIGVAQFL